MWKLGNRSKAWNGPQKCRVSILITSLILIILVLISIYRDNGQNSRLSSGLLKQKWNSLESLVQFHPTIEVKNGTEIIWQIPDTPKAVFWFMGAMAELLTFGTDLLPALIALGCLKKGFSSFTRLLESLLFLPYQVWGDAGHLGRKD